MQLPFVTLTTSNDTPVYVNAASIAYLEPHPSNSAYTRVHLNGTSVVVRHTLDSLLELLGR
jgi:hypothetical protein